MTAELTGRLIAAAVATIRDNAENLTRLDQAIGDGDHVINMKRGFDAIDAAAGEIAALPWGQALQKLGMTLVMKVGGASGPLYGSLFMAMGKAAGDMPRDAAALTAMVQAGVAAVKQRGKSDVGAKTMLEVLVPVETVLRAAGADATRADLLAAVRTAADAGLESTRPMQATKGRAAFLGARSIGHLDPGARSSQLLVHAVCDVVAGMEDLP
jgi:dihydroxyacetone kinase-like protein